MEGTVDPVEWEETGPEESTHTNGVRRITDQVGMIMQWHTDKGTLHGPEKKRATT